MFSNGGESRRNSRVGNGAVSSIQLINDVVATIKKKSDAMHLMSGDDRNNAELEHELSKGLL